ncbi:ribosome-binding protein 1 isoform X2 [Lethenteron reissneri]|uniref:ribosome-binding protein 1 isoform X2 n=1 Tax=Lethenteron reissneri TaxID=7753 RepID=UPI002AB737A0|nr:ribosome-binding protein 1 isoform X2 [Lethenteron reissneri]
MDLYDPQTLGLVVFGAFMLVSALGIFLVSTFSMKETSFEEALAAQRKQDKSLLFKAGDKKKKEKVTDKPKRKKKDEKPNGQVVDGEAEMLVVDVEEVKYESAPIVSTPPSQDMGAKDKKKKQADKKVGKAEQAAAEVPPSVGPSGKVNHQTGLAQGKKSEVPLKKQEVVSQEAQKKSPDLVNTKKKSGADKKGKPDSSEPAPVIQAKLASTTASAPPSTKPQNAFPQNVTQSVAPVKVPQVAEKAPVVAPQPKLEKVVAPVTKADAPPARAPAVEEIKVAIEEIKVAVEEAKAPIAAEPAAKKKSSNKKGKNETGAAEGHVAVPYRTLLDIVSGMVFSQGEAERLMEVLTEKTGGRMQGTWHMASAKGDPVAAVKKQLEEREKQLSIEKEEATAAKARLKQLTQEVTTERVKWAALETKLREQANDKESEAKALQARMQASYEDHTKEEQQLQTKVRELQEELDTSLTNLRKDNTILREALTNSTSQLDSKANAELAKLRQDCARLTKELHDKTMSQQKEDKQKETVAGYEQQIAQLKKEQQESVSTLQSRVSEVAAELRKAQANVDSLTDDIKKSKAELQSSLQQSGEVQGKLSAAEQQAEQQKRELEGLRAELASSQGEKEQLQERICSVEALLQASASQEKEPSQNVDASVISELKESHMEEIQKLQTQVKERDDQLAAFEKQVLLLSESVEQQKQKNNDLREKNWKAMEAVNSAEQLSSASSTAKEDLEKKMEEIERHTRETLQNLFPTVPVPAETKLKQWLQEFEKLAEESLKQQKEAGSSSVELTQQLEEADQARKHAQSECDKYKAVLADTEGILKQLQGSVEAEEQRWRSQIAEAESSLQQSQERVQVLEESLHKLQGESQSSVQLQATVSKLETQLTEAQAESEKQSAYAAELKGKLSDSDCKFTAVDAEMQKQSEELISVRQQLSEIQTRLLEAESASSSDQAFVLMDDIELEGLRGQISEMMARLEVEDQKPHTEREHSEQLNGSGDGASGDAAETTKLKERLEKEKKLTKDLGQAAMKLQQLLKATQEQLNKERENSKKLSSNSAVVPPVKDLKEDETADGTSVQ